MASRDAGQSSGGASPPHFDVDGLKSYVHSVFDDEVAALFESSMQARYKTLEAAGSKVEEVRAAMRAVEGALAESQAALQAERAAREAAELTVAVKVDRIGELKEEMKLQRAQIAKLGRDLQDQEARYRRVEARAARVPFLETRLAKGLASEARKLEAVSARGRTEGFHLGFRRALREVGERYPGLRAETARLSVDEAMAEEFGAEAGTSAGGRA